MALFMRRVSSIDMRQTSQWLTGLVRTMDAITRAGVCSPIDTTLRDRFAAHLRQPKPLARIPLAPDLDEAQPSWSERVKS
jgi:hypothetical protein